MVLTFYIIMPFAAPDTAPSLSPAGIFGVFTGIFDKATPLTVWHYVYFGIGAALAVYYFVWHYWAVCCAGFIYDLMIIGAWLVLFFLGFALSFFVREPLWNCVMFVIIAAPYVWLMWKPTKEAAELKKAGKPLPEGRSSLLERFMGGFCMDGEIMWVKTIFFLILLFTGIGVFISTLNSEILIPASMSAGIKFGMMGILEWSLVSLFIIVPTMFFIAIIFQRKYLFAAVLAIFAIGIVTCFNSWGWFGTSAFPDFVYRMANIEPPSAVRINMRDYAGKVYVYTAGDPKIVDKIPAKTEARHGNTKLYPNPEKKGDVIKTLDEGFGSRSMDRREREAVTLTGIASGNHMIEVISGGDTCWAVEDDMQIAYENGSLLSQIYDMRKGENTVNFEPYATTIKGNFMDGSNTPLFRYAWCKAKSPYYNKDYYKLFSIRWLNTGDSVTLTGKAASNFMVEVKQGGDNGWVGAWALAEQPPLRKAFKEKRKAQ
jgi:uncharacterized protein YraI